MTLYMSKYQGSKRLHCLDPFHANLFHANLFHAIQRGGGAAVVILGLLCMVLVVAV